MRIYINLRKGWANVCFPTEREGLHSASLANKIFEISKGGEGLYIAPLIYARVLSTPSLLATPAILTR